MIEKRNCTIIKKKHVKELKCKNTTKNYNKGDTMLGILLQTINTNKDYDIQKIYTERYIQVGHQIYLILDRKKTHKYLYLAVEPTEK